MLETLAESNIKYLYERGDLSFAKLKEKLINSSKLIKLKKKDKKQTDPKTGKGLLLSFSVKEGKIKLAINVSEAKMGGYDVKKTCQSYGDLKESAMKSLSMFENKIHNLSLEEQINLFGESTNKFYKIKLTNFTSEGVRNYDSRHMLVEKDGTYLNGPSVMEEVTQQTTKFENLINEWHQSINLEEYSMHGKAVKRLNECYNGEYGNNAVNKLNSNLSSVNSLIGNNKLSLGDDSQINDYMLARVYVLLNGMLDTPKGERFDPITKMNIAKKLLGVGGISVPDLMRKVPEEKKIFVKENILNHDSKKEILSNAIKPIENIVFDFIGDNLNSAKALLFLQDSPESRRMIKQVDQNLNLMKTGGSINTYRNSLRGLKNLDRYLKTNNTFAFDYDGMTYEPQYETSPISQMLEMLKFVENNDKITSVNNKNVLEIKDVYNIVKEMSSMGAGGVSFGAMPKTNILRKKRKWNKSKN